MYVSKRKLAVNLKPTMSISQMDDSRWKIELDMGTTGTETIFDEECEVDTCKYAC